MYECHFSSHGICLSVINSCSNFDGSIHAVLLTPSFICLPRQIAGNTGILLSYIADSALAGFPNNVNWRLMIGVGALPPLFLAVATLLAMPETPRWLVLHGHHDEARLVLARTTGDAALADRRLKEIVSSAQESSKQAVPGGSDERTRSTSVWRDILVRPTRSVRRVLLAILGLQFFQQASGVAALGLYAPRGFHHARVTSPPAVLGATILLGVAKIVAIVIPLFLADGWAGVPCCSPVRAA